MEIIRKGELILWEIKKQCLLLADKKFISLMNLITREKSLRNIKN